MGSLFDLGIYKEKEKQKNNEQTKTIA